MIALDITLTWLALTAAGFAALSALGRIELGDELEPGRTSREPHTFALIETWPTMPGGSPL